jgi:hypothetical protein
MVKPAVSSALSSLPDGQGLLIAAADLKHSTACVVGSVPVADGSFADAAGVLLACRVSLGHHAVKLAVSIPQPPSCSNLLGD